MKMFLVTMAAGLLVILAIAGGVYHWQDQDAALITGHGLIALALGLFFTLALGAGLMALAFHSSRRGHDERVDEHRDDPPRED